MLKNSRLPAILTVFALLLPLIACEQAKPGNPAPAPAPAPTTGPASAPPAAPAKAMHWDAPPAMTLDLAKTYTATMVLKKGGSVTLALDAKAAPLAVNSFVFLCRQGFYDGLTFHRVIDGFMAQGGDPTGTGMGGPGYKFKNEESNLRFDRAGVLAMANAGRDTNGSQFFITFDKAPNLNGDYTIFGQVTQGMDTVNKITRRDPDDNAPAGDVIESVVIDEK